MLRATMVTIDLMTDDFEAVEAKDLMRAGEGANYEVFRRPIFRQSLDPHSLV
jgi:hypothetical protein